MAPLAVGTPASGGPNDGTHPRGRRQARHDVRQGAGRAPRRAVAGTAALTRPRSPRQAAGAPEPSHAPVRSHIKWAVTHFKWARNPTIRGPSDTRSPAPATKRRSQGQHALRQTPRRRPARRRRARIGPPTVGSNGGLAHLLWDFPPTERGIPPCFRREPRPSNVGTYTVVCGSAHLTCSHGRIGAPYVPQAAHVMRPIAPIQVWGRRILCAFLHRHPTAPYPGIRWPLSGTLLEQDEVSWIDAERWLLTAANTP